MPLSDISNNKKKKFNSLKDESGVAIIIALIMLLVMSVMGITIAFYTNIDFFSMQNYKRGHEAFLAAERCIVEVRKQFESVGIEQILFEAQGGVQNGIEIKIAEDGEPCATPVDGSPPPLNNLDGDDDIGCSYCRTGPRNLVRVDKTDPIPFTIILGDIKSAGRAIKHTSLPTGGKGGATFLPINFAVTGKDRRDEDKYDVDTSIDTGIEIAGGIETFIPGGASNVY